jgi:SAM-dependent methyltransferase
VALGHPGIARALKFPATATVPRSA